MPRLSDEQKAQRRSRRWRQRRGKGRWRERRPPPGGSERAWSSWADTIRRKARSLGWPDARTAEMLGDVEPLFRAVERARARVDDEVVWAFVALAAERMCGPPRQ
jgi:ribosome-binding protein aMBF1 (putative translation factor)